MHVQLKTLAAALAVSATFAAQAATVVYTTTTPIPITTGLELNGNFVLQDFNPSLGTLTGVIIDFELDTTATLRVESKQASTPRRDLRALLTTVAVVKAPDLSTLISTSTNVIDFSYRPTAFDNLIDYDGGSGRTVSFGPMATTGSAFPLNFAAYTGVGTFSLPVSTSTNFALSGGINVVYQYSAYAGGTAKVTYTYTPTPVPEPETWALFLAGIAAVSLKLRRRS